jgi:hypothetical protein
MLPSAPRPENLRDRPRQFVPFASFNRQLTHACGCQCVKLRPAIVFRGSRFDRDPSPLDQPVQRWIQRSLLHLKHLVRPEVDCLGDGVTVHGAETKGAENQQIQGALKQIDTSPLFFGNGQYTAKQNVPNPG